VEGKTFRWSGVYEDLNQAKTLDTQLNVFADFKPELPESYIESDYLFLGNIHPQLQLDVLNKTNHKISACDTMNFWISSEKELLTEVIKKVDILFINDDEIKQFTDESNIFKAAENLLEMGTKLIIVKRGEFGAVALSKEMKFYAPAYPVMNVIDPTGAGDSFAGGFMGYLTNCDSFDEKSIKNAMLTGTVCASYNIEEFSLRKLKDLKKEHIESRVTELLEYMGIK
jgi:sugar/nucleoside kinase (ribokinase family)